jgi:GNAT superfamily N-acetyltransferase
MMPNKMSSGHLSAAADFCVRHRKVKHVECVIREVQEVDLPVVLSLYSRLAIDEETVLNIEKAKAIFRKIKSYPYYRLFVACFEGKIVGTYSLTILDNLVHMGAPSGVVESVVVLPHYRGRGVGTVMMKHAMRLCQGAHCHKLTLSSNLVRESAHRFYQNLGFKQHGFSFVVETNR